MGAQRGKGSAAATVDVSDAAPSPPGPTAPDGPLAYARTQAPDESSSLTRSAQAAPAPVHDMPWEQRLTAEQPGRYVTQHKLGEGAFGEVLAVFDRHLERSVALKQLHLGPPKLRTARELRFMNEARITGKLEHPSIVPIYELGRRSGGDTVYFVMRKVAGNTLRDALGVPFEERIKLLPHFLDVCDALAYAHSRGVIHRDIKPDNIMLGPYGETLVLDWGLAKVRGEDDEVVGEDAPASEQGMEKVRHQSAVRTLVGSVVGTPAYMPAEQCRGQLDAIDERSDVYALGAVLYHLLTGRPPYLGQSARETIEQTIEGELVPPRVKEPRCPDELNAIACQALQPDRAARYADAAEMAKDVRAYLDGGLVAAHRYSLSQRLIRGVRRYRWALAALVLSAGVALGTWVYRDHENQQQALAQQAQLEREQQARDDARRAELMGELDTILKDTERGSSQQRWLQTYALRIVRLNEPVAEKQLHERLVVALSHPSRDVRRLAARSLGGLPGERSIQLLSARLAEDGEQDEDVQVELISALAVIGDARAEEAVRKARWRAGQWSTLWNRTELAYSMIPMPPAEAGMSADAWTDRGRSLANKGDSEAALKAYSRALEIDPKLGRAFNNRAIELARRDRFDEALRDYNAAIALSPGDLKSLYNRAVLKRRMEDYEGALADYSTIIDRGGKLAKIALRARAMAHRLLDQPDRALNDYEAALALAPNDSRTHLSMGRAYEERDDWSRATASFDRALVHNPQLTTALILRGTVQWQAGDTAAALRDLERAILLDPGRSDARQYRAALHMSLGDGKAAREDVEHCLTRSCPDPEMQWMRYAGRAVLLHAGLGAYEQAQDDLERSHELAERRRDTVAVVLYGLAVARAAGDDAAEKRWRARSHPSEARWWHERLLRMLRGVHGFEALEARTPRKTNRCELYLAAGLHHEMAGRNEQALALYQRVTEVHRPYELACTLALRAAERLSAP